MTDSTGMLQHASYTIPIFAEGYCTDDNARALLLTVLLEELGLEGSPECAGCDHDLCRLPAIRLRPRPPALPQLHELRPPLAGGGRLGGLPRAALWALGTCIGRSQLGNLPFWAASHFEQALPAMLEMTSPRAWAFGLLGIHEYLRRLSGDRLVDAGPRHAHRPG